MPPSGMARVLYQMCPSPLTSILGKINLETGERVEYDMASPFSEPYSIKLNRKTDLIWISGVG